MTLPSIDRWQVAGDAQGDCADCGSRCFSGRPEKSRLWIFRANGSGGEAIGCNRACATPVENTADIERSVESFAGTPNGGLLLPPDITTITHRDLILALAERHRLPAVYPFRLFVEKGGLISYGTDQIAMFGQTAT